MAEEKRIGLTLEHLISKHNDYMITTDINKGLGLIEESLKWANDYGKESFPRDVFKDYRRQMKTIQEALSENCSAAAYGESQVGKSYLMSSLLSSPNAPFVIENKNMTYSFIDEINPSGGNVSKNESTGVVTRFTLRKGNEKMKDFIKIKNLSVVDLILLLTDSYYNDLKINLDSGLKYDDINRIISDNIGTWADKGFHQEYITEDDVRNISEYVRDIIGNNAASVYQSNFCKEIARSIEHISSDKWVNVFGLLWNNNPEFNKLFSTLIYEYKKLDFKSEVFLPFDAVLRKKGTILKIDWLNTVFGTTIKLEEGEEKTTNVYSPDGNLLSKDFSKGILSALIEEITFVLPESIAKERKFLNKIDLLDFPGARSREKFKEETLKENLPMVLRRGKVAYLFNKYSRSKMISSVLFCHHNDQKTEPSLSNSITSWINNEIGKTPEERASQLNLTNGISPLFMICTKFNIDLVKTKTDSKGGSLDSHWDRFKKALPELINNESWFDDWVPISGRFASHYFQNIYLLRDFFWSSKELFNGYSDRKASLSSETSLKEFPDYPEYFDDLRNSFMRNQFVRNHFENPSQSWSDVATVNNDGSKAIIARLDAIAEVLDSARHQKYLRELSDIQKDIINRLNVYYESEDKEAKNLKVRQITGDIKLQLAAVVGSKPETFGQIIDGLMIKSSDVRTIAYDIIVRHIDEPKDLSFIKLVRAECAINPDDSRESNLLKLTKRYARSVDELEKFFNDRGFSLDNIIEDDSDLSITTADVIAKHIIDFWNDHINGQVKILEKVLPHSDEVVFMLTSLLEKLGVKEQISNKINGYCELFSEGSLPSVIADYASLTLNNFVSTVGRSYMNETDIRSITEKADACDLEVDLSPSGSDFVRKPQPLLEALTALEDSRSLLRGQDAIDMTTLRKLPFWDNFQRWENLVTIGLLYSSDISHVDPVANAAVKSIIDRCNILYQN